MNKKSLSFIGLIIVSLCAFAALYGPFTCSNGCDARNPADGMTRAFISSDVNSILSQRAAERGQVHTWKPGDQLTICDGNWCATSNYHPLTGLFIHNPAKFPAYPDPGRSVQGNTIPYTPDELQLVSSVFRACLLGTFGNMIDSNYAYLTPDGTYVVGVTTRLNFGSDVCGM